MGVAQPPSTQPPSVGVAQPPSRMVSDDGRFKYRAYGYEIHQILGVGSFGCAYKVVRQQDRRVYALKEIDLRNMSRQEQEECAREAIVLRDCRGSGHVIKYYDSFFAQGNLCIVTEYASGGDLQNHMRGLQDHEAVPEELIWKLFTQMLLGLNHMHSRRIWHRDIKMANMFLTAEMDLKLGDVGVAKKLATDEYVAVAPRGIGSPAFMSPELRASQPYNEKTDVWALGVVLYYLCTKRLPSTSPRQETPTEPVPDIETVMNANSWRYSADIKDVIRRCLTQDPAWRPDTHQLLLLPSVRGRMSTVLGLRPTPAQATALRLRVPSAQAQPGQPQGRVAASDVVPAHPAYPVG